MPGEAAKFDIFPWSPPATLDAAPSGTGGATECSTGACGSDSTAWSASSGSAATVPVPSSVMHAPPSAAADSTARQNAVRYIDIIPSSLKMELQNSQYLNDSTAHIADVGRATYFGEFDLDIGLSDRMVTSGDPVWTRTACRAS